MSHTIFRTIMQLKDIFWSWMSLGQGELLSKRNTRYLRFLRAYLGWALKPMSQNYRLSEYIFNLFIAILYAKMSCVTWALHLFSPDQPPCPSNPFMFLRLCLLHTQKVPKVARL